MKNLANELADTMHNMDNDDEIEQMIIDASVKSGFDFKLLCRATQNAYYTKYLRGNSPKVDERYVTD